MLKNKKLKTRSIKTNKPLIEHKTNTKINLLVNSTRFLPVFIETAPEVARNEIK